MEERWKTNLREQLVRHEGLRTLPYRDTEGLLTIGVGRNLEHRGITAAEAMLLLDNDMELAAKDADRWLMNFDALSDKRKQAVINLAFNLGYARLSGFRKMQRAIEEERWEDAARELLDSKYAKQVKGRAVELAEMLRKG